MNKNANKCLQNVAQISMKIKQLIKQVRKHLRKNLGKLCMKKFRKKLKWKLMIRSREAQHQNFLNILTEVMKANNSKNLTRNQILTFLDHPAQFKMKTND